MPGMTRGWPVHERWGIQRSMLFYWNVLREKNQPKIGNNQEWQNSFGTSTFGESGRHPRQQRSSRCQNNKIGGPSWGVEFGVDDLAAAYVGAVSMKKGPSLGVALWFDYNNVFLGFTITPGFGVGADFGGVIYAGYGVVGQTLTIGEGVTLQGYGQLSYSSGATVTNNGRIDADTSAPKLAKTC